jgi:hypothetical protein
MLVRMKVSLGFVGLKKLDTTPQLNEVELAGERMKQRDGVIVGVGFVLTDNACIFDTD